MGRMKRSWIGVFAFSLAILMLLPGIVAAPSPAYMWVTGNNQGDIEGSVTVAGREDTIKVYDMEHEVAIPTDERGSPTGARFHGPLTITKEVDKSSPLLHQALTTGERLDIDLKFFRTTPSGAEEQYYTVKLEDAMIVSIKSQFTTDNEKGTELGYMEDVAFVYDKITWTWEPEGIESQDSTRNLI